MDERALDAFIGAFAGHGLDERIYRTMDQKIVAGLEAYEAAKWRPIEEAPRDGKPFLVWLKADAYPKLHLLHWDAYDREFHDVTGMCWSEHGDVINGAMFRTIDPPPQDADCSEPGPTKNERG